MPGAAWYVRAVVGQFGTNATRRIQWNSDAITVSLHTTAYALNQDTDEFFSVATGEVAGGGYVRQVLSGKAVATSAPSAPARNALELRASDTTFADLTATFRYAVVWKDTGTASASPLLGFVDFGSVSITAAPFVIDWHPTFGVLRAVTG